MSNDELRNMLGEQADHAAAASAHRGDPNVVIGRRIRRRTRIRAAGVAVVTAAAIALGAVAIPKLTDSAVVPVQPPAGTEKPTSTYGSEYPAPKLTPTGTTTQCTPEATPEERSPMLNDAPHGMPFGQQYTASSPDRTARFTVTVGDLVRRVPSGLDVPRPKLAKEYLVATVTVEVSIGPWKSEDFGFQVRTGSETRPKAFDSVKPFDNTELPACTIATGEVYFDAPEDEYSVAMVVWFNGRAVTENTWTYEQTSVEEPRPTAPQIAAVRYAKFPVRIDGDNLIRTYELKAGTTSETFTVDIPPSGLTYAVQCVIPVVENRKRPSVSAVLTTASGESVPVDEPCWHGPYASRSVQVRPSAGPATLMVRVDGSDPSAPQTQVAVAIYDDAGEMKTQDGASVPVLRGQPPTELRLQRLETLVLTPTNRVLKIDLPKTSERPEFTIGATGDAGRGTITYNKDDDNLELKPTENFSIGAGPARTITFTPTDPTSTGTLYVAIYSAMSAESPTPTPTATSTKCTPSETPEGHPPLVADSPRFSSLSEPHQVYSPDGKAMAEVTVTKVERRAPTGTNLPSLAPEHLAVTVIVEVMFGTWDPAPFVFQVRDESVLPYKAFDALTTVGAGPLASCSVTTSELLFDVPDGRYTPQLAIRHDGTDDVQDIWTND